jgi:hypothetical protein
VADPQVAGMLRLQLRQELERLTNAFYRRQIAAIRIESGPGSCEACRLACGDYHPLRVPRLPHASCTHELGCRCSYRPIASRSVPDFADA